MIFLYSDGWLPSLVSLVEDIQGLLYNIRQVIPYLNQGPDNPTLELSRLTG